MSKWKLFFWTSFPNGKYNEKTCISIVFPIRFTIGIVGWTQFWEPKTSTGDNFTPKWSWGLIFSGSVVLMSTTIYYNMKVELSLLAEIESDIFFLAKLIL